MTAGPSPRKTTVCAGVVRCPHPFWRGPEMSYPLFSVVAVGRGCDGFLRGVPGCAAAGADPREVAHRAPAGVGRRSTGCSMGCRIRRCCAPSSGPGRWPGWRRSATGWTYLTAVAGAADTHGDSRVLGAGTTGTLVAAATGSTVAAGSAIVATARDLQAFPELARAFAAGRVSGQHVSVILATTEGVKAAGAGRGCGRGPGRGHRPAGDPACAAGHRRCPGRRARAALATPSSGPAAGCG